MKKSSGRTKKKVQIQEYVETMAEEVKTDVAPEAESTPVPEVPAISPDPLETEASMAITLLSETTGITDVPCEPEKGRKSGLDILKLNRPVERFTEDVSPEEQLWWAANDGDRELVEDLIDAGTSAAWANKKFYGSTALHMAARGGFADICDVLINNGAQVNIKNSYSRHPLHYAAASGDEETVRLLLQHRAHVAARDSAWQTALHWAARRGRCPVASLLLDYGAVPLTKSKTGETAREVAQAAGYSDVVDLLLRWEVHAPYGQLPAHPTDPTDIFSEKEPTY